MGYCPADRGRPSPACGRHGVRTKPDPGRHASTSWHELGHVGGDALPPVLSGSATCCGVTSSSRSRARTSWAQCNRSSANPTETLAVIINLGGFLGFGSRSVSVPVDALVLLGQVVEVDAFTPAQLRQLQTFSPGTAVPLPPDAVIKVGLAKPSH